MTCNPAFTHGWSRGALLALGPTRIDNVAGQTNLYKYPTNNVWPFILPATEDELKTDITEFPDGRESKFELVCDVYDSNPTIQIDIETDLTRTEIERLPPEPYGISFPEVADFFRTVYSRSAQADRAPRLQSWVNEFLSSFSSYGVR